MSEENVATIPQEEVIEEVQEEQQVTEEVSEDTPVEDTEEVAEITDKEQGQVDLVSSLVASGDIPKGVEPFVDDNGKLKFVMPIDGKKYIVNFNQVLSGFNLNQAGERKLQDGKALQKQFDQILKDISADNPEGRKNLKKLALKLGHNIGEIGEDFLNEVIEEAQIPEEEKRIRARERALEEREAALKAKEEEEETKEQNKIVLQKQEEFTKEALEAMKSRKLDDVDKELSKKILTDVFARMLNSRKAGHGMSAANALDEVLMEYDLLLGNLPKMYTKEHMKKRIPSEFRKLVMGMSLEDTPPPVGSSIQGGALELEDYEDTRVKKTKKKIPLSEWVPK